MRLKLYQVDAFSKKPFEGNPAAICPLESWLPDTLMQQIAAENNLSETAFFVKEGELFHIRWFTPTLEVDMCGHATLASAHILFSQLGYEEDTILFNSKSGLLSVKKEGRKLQMDFPVQQLNSCVVPSIMIEAFGKEPIACFCAMDYLVIFENEEDIVTMKPNLEKLKQLDSKRRGVIITAKSEAYDFVTRFFAPLAGVDEDPVTGSAFTQLIPYWSEILNKNNLHAKQLSKRGGEVFSSLKEDRVLISGYAVTYLIGEIEIP